MECFQFLQRRQLLITSPLKCTGKRKSPEAHCCVTSTPWRAFCPNCARPIDIALQKVTHEKPVAQQRHAYVITLWGQSPSYILGALVLGRSLRKVGSTKDLVVLHTSDVIGADLLRQTGWMTIEVTHIESATRLFSDPTRGRFDRVFTKLHALNLTQYDKVCMLDIDMLVMQNIDDVFDIPAPAAMRRGQAHVSHVYKHGQCVQGESFFFGGRFNGQNVEPGGDWQTWGQAAGINAGLMVLQPDADVFLNMVAEVADPNHPSHVAGNGPEQDYLSRYYADQWRHISVEYNYQLHQLYFALHPKDVFHSVRADLCRQGLEKIKVIHYSGDKGLKPWDYVSQLVLEKEPKKMDDFVETVLEGFQGYLLWSQRDKETWEYLMESDHFSIEYLKYRDGKIYWDDGTEAIVPDEHKKAARWIVQGSFERWAVIFKELEDELNMCIVRELFNRMPTDTSTSGGSEDASAYKVTKSKHTWTKMNSWWGVLQGKLKENEYRLVVLADDNNLQMVLPGGTFRSTDAPIFASHVPHKPVELHSSAQLCDWLNSIPNGALISVAMRQPTRDTMAVMNDIGASFPVPTDDEPMLRAHFVCTGMRGLNVANNWNCVLDENIAVSYDTITIPAELLAQA